MAATKTIPKYVITFQRIGRKRDLPPLEVEGDAGAIAETVFRFANGHLGSKMFEVRVNLETMTGSIEWGRFGTFTLAPR